MSNLFNKYKNFYHIRLSVPIRFLVFIRFLKSKKNLVGELSW